MRGTIFLCFAIAFGFIAPNLGFAAEADFAINEVPRSCGVPSPSELRELEGARGTFGDCTLSVTIPDPSYDPGDYFVIDVVVHVIFKSDNTGFFSLDEVRDQIRVLNDDFNARGDASSGADAKIRFRLDTVDYVEDDAEFDCVYPCDNVTYHALNPESKLNIYTVNGGSAGFRGWATFPQLPADVGTDRDAVFVDYRTFGLLSPQYPYDRGHTLAHEVGHYLGLLHVFAPEPLGCPTGSVGGSPSCYEDEGDLLCDTNPAFEAYNELTCSAPPVLACSATGAWNPASNYMNYSPDICLFGFSPEQVNRARCALESYRAGQHEAMIFFDDFESGDSTYWSDTVTAKMNGKDN